MDIKSKLIEFKRYIVFLGLGIGVGYIFGFLPDSFEPLGNNVKFVYVALIALAGYTFHIGYGYIQPLNIHREVPTRDLSSQSHLQELERQSGGPVPPPRVDVPPQPQQPQPERRESVSKNVWDDFRKE